MKFTFLVTIAWIVTFSTVGNGQQRPLQIEDPRPISQGHVLVEVGFDFFKNGDNNKKPGASRRVKMIKKKLQMIKK